MIDVTSRPVSRTAEHQSLEEVNEPYSDSNSDDNDEAGGKSLDSRSNIPSLTVSKGSPSIGSGHRRDANERLSVSDRLVSSLSKNSSPGPPPHKRLSPPSRQTSLLSAPPLGATDLSSNPDSPTSPLLMLPKQWRIPPPSQRFLQCAEDDLRLGEVGDLLREYRRVVEALRMVGGFDEI